MVSGGWMDWVWLTGKGPFTGYEFVSAGKLEIISMGIQQTQKKEVLIMG